MSKPVSKDVTPKDEESEAKDNQTATHEASGEEAKSVSGKPDTSEKPRYDKLTTLTIESAIARKTNESKTDGTGDDYFQWRVVVRYNDKSTEAYGGLREYKDRIWYGPDSAFGEVKGMLEKHIGAERKLTLEDFVKELPGRKVKVKSRDWKVGGQQGFKNIPVEFMEE